MDWNTKHSCENWIPTIHCGHYNNKHRCGTCCHHYEDDRGVWCGLNSNNRQE